MRQGELLRPPGHSHPRRVAGEPQADLDAARGGRGGDGEALVEAFERLGPTGDLDDEACWGRRHGTQATITPVEAFYIALLVLTVVVVTWFAGYVVYRLVRSPR